MCLTSRMELTGWYCRDQDVTKPCVLLHVWSQLDGPIFLIPDKLFTLYYSLFQINGLICITPYHR